MMIGTLDTQPDRTALPRLRELLTFARDHEDAYRDLTSAARIALLWSQRTATPAPGWGDTTDRYVKHFRGWYDLLTRRHHLFDVISDTQLEGEQSGFPGQRAPATLRERYSLVVAPNPARLDAPTCAALDEYVNLGGTLVVIGAPPLGQEGLRSLGATQLEALRERVSNSYLRIRDRDRTGDGETLPFSRPGLAELDLLPVEGRLWHVAPRPDAQQQLALIPPEDYGAPEQTYFAVETEHPGLLWHRHGDGRTVYLPWEPDRAWFDAGVESLGLFLGSLVDHLAPPARVQCDAPEAVELTAHRQAGSGRLVIHLVNGSGAAPPRWAEPAPVHDVVVRFQWPLGTTSAPAGSSDGTAPQVRALRHGMPLPVSAAGAAGYQVTLPLLGLFEVLLVE
jgi:hypothetical protein